MQVRYLRTIILIWLKGQRATVPIFYDNSYLILTDISNPIIDNSDLYETVIKLLNCPSF